MADVTKESTILTTPYSNIWIGSDVLNFGKKSQDGNSIVAQINASSYLFIGSKVVEFSLMPGDAIQLFQSEVGNSSVPYPYIIGQTHTYFMLDFVAIPNERLNLLKNAYSQFYGHIPGANGQQQKMIKRGKKLTIRVRHSSEF